MNDKYVRIFKEEDETVDISLCDKALKLLANVEECVREECSKEEIFEEIDRVKYVIEDLKKREVSEDSRVVGTHPESGLDYDFERKPWMQDNIPE